MSSKTSNIIKTLFFLFFLLLTIDTQEANNTNIGDNSTVSSTLVSELKVNETNNNNNNTSNSSSSTAIEDNLNINENSINPIDSVWDGIKSKQEEVQKVLKTLIAEVKAISQTISLTIKEKAELSAKIKKLSELSSTLDRRIELYDTDRKLKINKLSHKLIGDIVSQMMIDLIDLKKKIEEIKIKLADESLKIEGFRKSLPNPNTVCAELTGCSSCVANPNCGWCASSNVCVEGNRDGPLRGKETCPSYNYQRCPENTDCSTYTHCNECLMDVACGWCSSVNLNLNLCMTKNEGETGLCNQHFFHHIWKADTTLSKCPKVNINNFVNYIENNLHDSSDFAFINKPSSADIKLPSRSDLKNTYDQLRTVTNNQILDQVNKDRLIRQYNQTKTTILNLEKQMDQLDTEMNINSTLKNEIITQKLKDLEYMIKLHLNVIKEGKQAEFDEKLQRDFDRFYKELNCTRNSTSNRNNTDERRTGKNFIKKGNDTLLTNDTVKGNDTGDYQVSVVQQSSFLEIEDKDADANTESSYGFIQKIINLIDMM